MFIKFFLNNIHSERHKADTIQLTDETRDSFSYSEDRFFLISMEIDIQLREKEKISRWVLTASKGYSGDADLIRITWNRKIAW